MNLCHDSSVAAFALGRRGAAVAGRGYEVVVVASGSVVAAGGIVVLGDVVDELEQVARPDEPCVQPKFE